MEPLFSPLDWRTYIAEKLSSIKPQEPTTEIFPASHAPGGFQRKHPLCDSAFFFLPRGSSRVTMVQNKWYHFGIDFGTYSSGDWHVDWGYGVLTHGHVFSFLPAAPVPFLLVQSEAEIWAWADDRSSPIGGRR